MRLLVKVSGIDAMIIGYCPSEGGGPLAIVVVDGGLQAVPLSEIELLRLPKPLRRSRRRTLRHIRQNGTGVPHSWTQPPEDAQ